MQHAYWELKREMSNLHLVTQVQAELLRKLKTSAAVKKGKSLLAGDADSSHTAWGAASYFILAKSHPMIVIHRLCAVCPLHPFPAVASVSSWSASHIKVLLVFFLQYYILSPCGFSQPSVAHVCKAEVLGLLWLALHHNYIFKKNSKPKFHFISVLWSIPKT